MIWRCAPPRDRRSWPATGRPCSNPLRNFWNTKVPKSAVSDYLVWFEDAYFLFTVRIFDASLARSNTNPKKIYCVDHALVNSVSSGILLNSGHLLENLVFTALRRHHPVPFQPPKDLTGKILARITAADAVDTGFVADTNADVLALALQLDGKILVGGKFTQVNGISRNFLVRVNTDGAVDSTFTPQVDNEVWTIKIQPDGKILIGGAFTTVNGQSRSGIARLLPAGTPDPNFNPGTGANLPVASIALQSDGRMVIGGMFSTFNGVGRSGIARLNPDGSLHQDFNPGAGVSRVGAVREPPLRWLRAPSPLWGRGGSDPGQARWPAPTGVALPPKSRRGVREPPPTVLGMGLGSFNFGN